MTDEIQLNKQNTHFLNHALWTKFLKNLLRSDVTDRRLTTRDLKSPSDLINVTQASFLPVTRTEKEFDDWMMAREQKYSVHNEGRVQLYCSKEHRLTTDVCGTYQIDTHKDFNEIRKQS